MSPFTPWGPTIALSFVLGVAAIKAIAEDRKRYIEDRKINTGIAHVIQPDGVHPPFPAPLHPELWMSLQFSVLVYVRAVVWLCLCEISGPGSVCM